MPRMKKEADKLKNSDIKDDIFENPVNTSKSSSGVVVDGIENCCVRFAKCCSPLPGDDIVGFVTKGYGISVHKKNCPNIAFDKREYKGRTVRAFWCKDVNRVFPISIEIIANYYESFLANLTRKVAAINAKLISLNSRINSEERIIANITLNVKNPEHLKFITDNLLKIENVVSVRRI